MASRETRDRMRELDREIERYRKAAILAVEQLQWSSATSTERSGLSSPSR
jgi:hypothetical protein